MAILHLWSGSFDGKMGGTVGARWKDKHTIRTLPNGKAPSTPAQTAALLRFGQLQRFTRMIRPWIEEKCRIRSPSLTNQNLLVQQNKEMISNKIFDPAGFRSPAGPLPIIYETNPVYNPITGTFSATRRYPPEWSAITPHFFLYAWGVDDTYIVGPAVSYGPGTTYTINIGAGLTGVVWSLIIWGAQETKTKRYSTGHINIAHITNAKERKITKDQKDLAVRLESDSNSIQTKLQNNTTQKEVILFEMTELAQIGK